MREHPDKTGGYSGSYYNLKPKEEESKQEEEREEELEQPEAKEPMLIEENRQNPEEEEG